jgi:hypothetical protein
MKRPIPVSFSMSLIAFAIAAAPAAALADNTPVARYHLEQAWPKGPPSSALSDLPKPDAATPRGTVQRVPVVVPDPRDPLSKPANKSLTLTESATGALGGPDTTTPRNVIRTQALWGVRTTPHAPQTKLLKAK